MESIDTLRDDIDEVTKEAEEYVTLQIDRLKLDLVERLTRSLTAFILLLILVFFVFAGLFLLCLGVLLVLQELFGNWVLSSGGALLFFVFLAWLTIRRGRPYLRDAIAKALIQTMYED